MVEPTPAWSTITCERARPPGTWRRIRKALKAAWGRRWWVVGPSLVIVFLVALHGFLAHYGDDVATAWWETFRLFHWHSHFKLGVPVTPGLQVARFAAPLLFAFALADALLVVLAWQRFRVGRSRRHVIVCGIGAKNLAVIEDLRAAGQRVTVIERDEEHALLSTVRDTGALVLAGDATQPRVLRRAAAHRASLVLASCDTDGTNAAIAVAASTIAASTPRPLELTCVAHVVDPDLRLQLSEMAALHGPGRPFRLRFYSMHENAARLLYVDHLGPALARRADRSRPAWVVVAGFGDTGEAVARKVLSSPCDEETRRTLLTVVDEHAEDRVASFVRRHPAVEGQGLGRVDAVSEYLEDGRELAEIVAAASAKEGGRAPDAVVVCFWDEWKSLTFGASVAAALGGAVPVYVRTPAAEMAGVLARSDGAAAARPRVHPFGVVPLCCAATWVVDEGLDVLAVEAHAAWRAQKLAMDPGADAPEWGALSEDFRASNRAQVDHITAKLARIGCHVERRAPGRASGRFPFTPAELETLARLEHVRWCAERWMAGWVFDDRADGVHRGHPPPRTEKKSNQLRPWRELDETRRLDYSAILAIPAQLQKRDLEIVRDA